MIHRSIGIALFLSALLFGNTYYIDYTGGSDANPGTSKSSPWKRCPGMTGFTATYSHAPGDVYIFKGGIIWPAAALPLTVANSGASGNTDSYTTDHSWFSGSSWAQPTLDGQLFGKTLLSVADRKYIKINDLRFINAGSLSANGIMAFKFINCSYLELSNNTFAPEAWGCLYISAEKTGDYYNILVHHNDLSRCAFGMRIVPAAPAAILHNVQIYNNSIHDFHSQLSGNVHGDGIQHYCSPDVDASYDRYIDGFKIYNNSFTGDFTQVAGSAGAMTALIYLSGTSIGIEVYNNLFAPYTKGTQSPNFFEAFVSLRDNPNRGGRHKFYNNTFVTMVPSGQAAGFLEDDLRLPSPYLSIKNNIFHGFQWPFDLRSASDTLDYNCITFTRSVGKWGSAGAWVDTWSAWQKLGNDIHGINADPQFVSSTDLRLKATSPCIGKGANLSSMLTTDIAGNARPASGGFSMGAYEYGGTPPPAVPIAPVLASPSSGATGVAVNPVLSWNAVSGALSYSIQVSTVSTFASTILNQVGIASASFQASGLSNNATYYWRVNATNANGTGSWSSTGNFQTVAMAALPAANLQLWWPGNGATGVVIDPSLTWGPDASALSYGLQVAADSGFAAIVFYKSGITTNSYEPNGLQNSTLYYWRVNATRAGGVSAWSSFRKFTTLAGAPSAPVLSLPSNTAAGIAIAPALSWNAVSGAVSYSLQVSTVSTFVSTVINQAGIASASYQASGLSNSTVYYWRVNAVNAVGTGTWSSVGSFTTDAVPSPTLALWWPANKAVGVVINPSLTWSVETGALSYALQVSVDSTFSAPLLYQTGVTTNSFDANVLSANTSYYWRVNATRASGTCGWSVARKFTTGGVLGKYATPVAAVQVRPVPAVLDIYSCRSGSVKLSLPSPGRYTLSLFTLDGRTLGRFEEYAPSAGPAMVSLKSRNLQRGYYVVRLLMNDVGITKKVYLMD